MSKVMATPIQPTKRLPFIYKFLFAAFVCTKRLPHIDTLQKNDNRQFKYYLKSYLDSVTIRKISYARFIKEIRLINLLAKFYNNSKNNESTLELLQKISLLPDTKLNLILNEKKLGSIAFLDLTPFFSPSMDTKTPFDVMCFRANLSAAINVALYNTKIGKQIASDAGNNSEVMQPTHDLKGIYFLKARTQNILEQDRKTRFNPLFNLE